MIIGIYSASPEYHGFGHYYRCLGLAQVLAAQRHTVFWKDSLMPDFNLGQDLGFELDWLIVDHPDETVINQLDARAKRRAYLHGNSELTRPMNEDAWDLIVVQGVRYGVRNINASRWLVGPQYALIRPEISNLVGIFRPPKENKVLVYPDDLTDLVPDDWVVAYPNDFHVDFGITRFGMISLELAALGIPQAIIYDTMVEPTAVYLKKTGAATLIKWEVAKKDRNVIKREVERIEVPFKPPIDGLGCWRLAHELELRL